MKAVINLAVTFFLLLSVFQAVGHSHDHDDHSANHCVACVFNKDLKNSTNTLNPELFSLIGPVKISVITFSNCEFKFQNYTFQNLLIRGPPTIS